MYIYLYNGIVFLLRNNINNEEKIMKVNQLSAPAAHKRLVAAERSDHHHHVQASRPNRSFTVNFLLIGVLL